MSAPLQHASAVCPRCNGRRETVRGQPLRSRPCSFCGGDGFVWEHELRGRIEAAPQKRISPRRPVSPSKPPPVQAPGDVVELGALERSPAAGTQPAPAYQRGVQLWPRGER